MPGASRISEPVRSTFTISAVAKPRLISYSAGSERLHRWATTSSTVDPTAASSASTIGGSTAHGGGVGGGADGSGGDGGAYAALDLPEADDAEDDEDGAEVLLGFRHDDAQYYVVRLLDPVFVVGKQVATSRFEIPSEREVERVAPALEEVMAQAATELLGDE